eukprot:NODE_3269_length_953_cov_17.487832_g2715_i0.p1 GENE.NODE_3269_length_953_cov_17.487832_g2715_i0~~NODE_3269_length_953_cov_17.487832_g2715_i0.p1  ORF type:complete len:210 (-),score=26.89 NODE_3269_length_953_cov_17.487832_g2715_i0:121-750(-)
MAAGGFDKAVKLLLIGDSGVGKSCLLYRYTDNSFNERFIATIGIDFKIKIVEVDGKRVQVKVWDTAGQEKFKTITQAYYRGAQGIMLCFDVTSIESFHNVKTWLANITEFAGMGDSPAKILVGNKTDLVERRLVTAQQGRQLAEQNHMAYYETSAKAGSGVEEAFLALATMALKPPMPSSAGPAAPAPDVVQLKGKSSTKSQKSEGCKC